MDVNEYDKVDYCCPGELSSVEDSIGEVIYSKKTLLCIWV